MNLKKHLWRFIQKLNQLINAARQLSAVLILPMLFTLHHSINYNFISQTSIQLITIIVSLPLIQAITMYGKDIFQRTENIENYLSNFTNRYFEEYKVAEQI